MTRKPGRPRLGTEAAGGDGSRQDHATPPIAADPFSLAAALQELAALLPGLKASLERQAAHRVEPLAYRIDEVAAALSLSRRVLERERSAGRFPAPDLNVGRMPLWKPETIRTWIERGGRR
jgi:hypothetical protein